MTVGIVGLGLIGGSLAKAYKLAGHEVLAHDIQPSILDIAMLNGTVDGVLDAQSLPRCTLVLVALYPAAAIAYMQQNAPYIAKEALVMDCCGTKRAVCQAGFALANQYDYTYVGGHPMAGTHFSGFAYSQPTLFKGAVMVVVPPRYDDMALLARIKEALSPCLFRALSVTTAEEHDRTIAFTSQLAHVVSNAYIKSPTAKQHRGVSAGSYRDLTRVAWLNPDMWTALFLENRDNLTGEIDTLIEALTQYRGALQKEDADTLHHLLDEGRKRKEDIDGVMP